MRTATLLGMTMVLAMLTACTGDVASGDGGSATDDPCAASASPDACDQCVAHAPRGIAGHPICQTAPGPAGASCCATTQADGGCVVAYFDGTREVSAACAPVAP